MGQMDISGSATSTIEIPRFDGVNTALAFSELRETEARDMLNALPGSLGSLAKRPGTIPLFDTTLTTPITRMFNLRKTVTGVRENILLVTSNNTLYEVDNGFAAQTMTNPFISNDVDATQFKDENAAEVLVLTDGGNLKYYDGTEVKDVVPADDTQDVNDGLPANDLTNINTNHPPTGCLVHNTRVVIWDGSDTIWHSKIGYYDYFPTTDYQRFVRKNDYVQGCVSYRGALIVLMRRHVGVLFGQDRDNWKQDFLDTQAGCLNPNTVQSVTFPDGKQEVFYLSDNGVHSIYALDTLALDSSARYSTRSVTDKKIDWEKLGVTNEEWQQAVAYYHKGQYWLIYPKGTEYKGLVFDTNYNNWYPIDSISANDFYHDEDYFYFVTEGGAVKVFDDELYSDWEDTAKTTGTPINWYWYSTLLTPGITGYDHMWDILLIEAKQFMQKSTIDVEVNTQNGQYSKPKGIKTAILIWGETEWGEAQWANTDMTDIVNNAKPMRVFLKGKYAQVKLSNNRDEPVEVISIQSQLRKMN